MDRAAVIKANTTLAQEDERAQNQSNVLVADLANVHVKQRQQLENYHVDDRKDDADRRWDERQDHHGRWRKSKAEETKKLQETEMEQREREAAEEAAAEKRAEEARRVKEGSMKQSAVLREWTTEFRSSPLATGSHVMPESSIDFNQLEEFPTNPCLTKSVAKAVGRPTKEVSHIQAELLVVTPDPQKEADEDKLQQIEQRIEMEMDRVSVMNIFHAQQAREQRLVAAKMAAHREIASDRAWAAKQAEDLQDNLQSKIHKISGRQAAAERAVIAAQAARESGQKVRKPSGPLTKEKERSLVDRLSAPKQVSAET